MASSSFKIDISRLETAAASRSLGIAPLGHICDTVEPSVAGPSDILQHPSQGADSFKRRPTYYRFVGLLGLTYLERVSIPNRFQSRVPLYEALDAGCTSVEADVWLEDGDLLVGHSENSLTPTRSLNSLYLDPLASILARQNAPSTLLPHNKQAEIPFASNTSGIFETNTNVSLTLLLDVKSNGAATLPLITQQLEPLRSKGWLTHTEGSTLVQGPITIVGSGNTPFPLPHPKNSTVIFFDAPLNQIWGDSNPATAKRTQYTPQNSLYASAKFSDVVGELWHGVLKPEQVDVVRGQIQAAKDLGLKVRYWDTPAWPVKVREHVWDVLVKEGVGVLNVDDLVGVKERSW
ncbi:MAG: hypothetical protein Q9201_005979 [Fulgogasparrea decipioides]